MYELKMIFVILVIIGKNLWQFYISATLRGIHIKKLVTLIVHGEFTYWEIMRTLWYKMWIHTIECNNTVDVLWLPWFIESS